MRIACLFAGLLWLSCSWGTALAATIQPQPTVKQAAVGEEFTLTLEGSGFTVPVTSGGVTVEWDNPGVLQYLSTLVANPPWIIFSVDASSADQGKVDFIIVATDPAVQDSSFAIADLRFKFIGGAGSSSTVRVSDAFGGWFTNPDAGNNPVSIPVTYQEAVVSAVPLPAASLLFGSGLLGLARIRRKR